MDWLGLATFVLGITALIVGMIDIARAALRERRESRRSGAHRRA